MFGSVTPVTKSESSAPTPNRRAVRLSRSSPSTRDSIVSADTRLMFFRCFDTRRSVRGAEAQPQDQRRSGGRLPRQQRRKDTKTGAKKTLSILGARSSRLGVFAPLLLPGINA